MREVQIPIEYIKPVLTNGRIVKEDIIERNDKRLYKTLSVKVQQFDVDNNMVRELDYIINGEKYDLLMSNSSIFQSGKPIEDFRLNDIWPIIDLIRSESESSS